MYKIKRTEKEDILIIQCSGYPNISFSIKPEYAIRQREKFNEDGELYISSDEAFYLICSNFYGTQQTLL